MVDRTPVKSWEEEEGGNQFEQGLWCALIMLYTSNFVLSPLIVARIWHCEM